MNSCGGFYRGKETPLDMLIKPPSCIVVEDHGN